MLITFAIIFLIIILYLNSIIDDPDIPYTHSQIIRNHKAKQKRAHAKIDEQSKIYDLNHRQIKFLKDRSTELEINDGVLECTDCHSYCGQCGGRWLGLTVEEFKKELG